MKKMALFLASLLFPLSGFAYYTFQDTGDLLEPGRYAVGGELQFKTSDGSGTNILGRFDSGWKDGLNWRGFVGLGKVDFQAGGYVKWVPVPDYGKQPAMGIAAGGLIASYESDTEFSARVYPFLSKKFEVEFGQLTPYGTIPLGLRTYDGESDSTAQLILGSRYIHPEMPGAHYYAEFGIDFDDTFSYLSIGASFPLNEEKLIDLWN